MLLALRKMFTFMRFACLPFISYKCGWPMMWLVSRWRGKVQNFLHGW